MNAEELSRMSGAGMSRRRADVDHYDLGGECVGYPEGEHLHRVWFSRWFLDDCHFAAPAVIWQRDGRIITRTYRSTYRRPSGEPNPPPMVWRLTDERDVHGCRLAVWPD